MEGRARGLSRLFLRLAVSMPLRLRAAIACLLVAAVATPAALRAEVPMRTTLNFYGMPGLVDMPTADSLPDGQLAVTASTFAGITRTTLAFQILPRVTGSFRYSRIGDFTGPGTPSNFDRSFDIHVRLLDESDLLPAVAAGLRDFIGTGIFAGEYVVATKQVHSRVRATAGLGFGRLGTANTVSSGFGTRGVRGAGDLGGRPNLNQWFRGDVGFFGGVEVRATERLYLKAELSSDAYRNETRNRVFERETAVNLGADLRLGRGLSLGAYYLMGSEVGILANIQFNPKEPPGGSGNEPAPQPLLVREGDAPPSAAWMAQTGGRQILRDNVTLLLEREGLVLQRLSLEADSATLWFTNTRFGVSAQAMGRAARVLTRALPASVETLVLIPVEMGMPTVAVTLRRSDLEALEHAPDGAWQSFVRARIADAASVAPEGLPGKAAGTRFAWGLGPYMASSLFDPDDPLRADFGAELSATLTLRPNFLLSGAVRKRVVGNLDEVTRFSNSRLPRVRSDFPRFDRQADPSVDYLTAEYFTRLGPALYGRATAGLLERMYGGVSGEVLWKPVESRLGLGIEVNYARLRDFDVLFDFQDYDVITGHASAYYDIGNGFLAQLDAGRYLAKDWGGTFTLTRRFSSGWKVGAFFTLTEVPFSKFGEGSFDKGILIELPLSWLSGQPSRTQLGTVLRPVLRDGGARLHVRNRLHGLVEGDHEDALGDGWGRFWR